MQEMGMQPGNIVAEFMCQHGGLPKPAQPVWCRITAEIAAELCPCHAPAGKASRGAEARNYAHRRLVKIFRQIGDGSGNVPVNGMNRFVGWMAQRYDADVQSGLFEGVNFLRNKCF